MDIVLRVVDRLLLLDEASGAKARERWGDARPKVIPNPIAIGQSAPLSVSSRKTILFLGWVTPAKGVEDLLVAWDVLSTAFPAWSLELVGAVSAPYREELTTRFGTSSWRLLGELDHKEAMARLAVADALVLPSHSEGFPNVLLEAMALRKAIVATRVGAVPEMLAEGTGILVPPANPKALQKALASVMRDEDLRRRLGLRGRAKVDRLYGATAIVDRYRDVWGI